MSRKTWNFGLYSAAVYRPKDTPNRCVWLIDINKTYIAYCVGSLRHTGGGHLQPPFWRQNDWKTDYIPYQIGNILDTWLHISNIFDISDILDTLFELVINVESTRYIRYFRYFFDIIYFFVAISDILDIECFWFAWN